MTHGRRFIRGTVRTGTRTYVKKANTLIASPRGQDPTQAVLEAISALDKAAQKGVIHKNQAARRKSRLMAALHKAQATAALIHSGSSWRTN